VQFARRSQPIGFLGRNGSPPFILGRFCPELDSGWETKRPGEGEVDALVPEGAMGLSGPCCSAFSKKATPASDPSRPKAELQPVPRGAPRMRIDLPRPDERPQATEPPASPITSPARRVTWRLPTAHALGKSGTVTPAPRFGQAGFPAKGIGRRGYCPSSLAFRPSWFPLLKELGAGVTVPPPLSI
jgi:hypothetical protein